MQVVRTFSSTVFVSQKSAPARYWRRVLFLGVKMASGPFTVAQLARAAGVGTKEVRFYRECGLLQLPRRRRRRGGDTAFNFEHVERLRLSGALAPTVSNLKPSPNLWTTVDR